MAVILACPALSDRLAEQRAEGRRDAYLGAMVQTRVSFGAGKVCVREVGDRIGWPIVYFHGTPSSRLDLAFADHLIAGMGIRLISFDRPGYGGSDPASFRLADMAHAAGQIADALGIASFSTFGVSGGGPFSLAAAAVLEDRVTAVGVASGPGPFNQVPGAIDELEDTERAALELLPDNPGQATDMLKASYAAATQDLLSSTSEDIIAAAQQDEQLTPSDRALLRDDVLATSFVRTLKEGARQGQLGAAWDTVVCLGSWDIDLGAVYCPAFLWYGDQDRMVCLSHGEWLREQLPNATLTVYPGEGHLAFMAHLSDMLTTLTPRTW